MKILIIGGNGTIGKVVAKKLRETDEVIIAGRNSGDIHIDTTSITSIENGFKKIGKLDAVIIAAGEVIFGKPFYEMTEEEFYVGIKSKLMGQINVVKIGLPYMNDKGAFTLTAGALNHEIYENCTGAALVNGAIEDFVKNAALELPRQIRINAVSPGLMPETAKTWGNNFLPGLLAVSEEVVTMAYVKSIKSGQTGQTYLVH